MSKPRAGQNAFNTAEVEDPQLNQYWYSDGTTAAMVNEIQMHATKAAFLSTPSLYFSLTKQNLKSNSKVFEFDQRWATDEGFVFYDFNKPEAVPADLWGAFDYIVVDPPFITREVWTKYAATVKLIAAPKAKVLFTSVIENHMMLEELCDVQLFVPAFQPSIPHLTYQYHCFVNYPPTGFLSAANPELPPEGPEVLQARALANDMRESQQQFQAQMHVRDRTGEVRLRPEDEVPAGVDSRLGKELANDAAMKWKHVPDGWTEYPDGCDPAAAAADNTGAPPIMSEAYLTVEKQRNQLEVAKKTIDEMVKATEAAVTAYEKLQKEPAEGSTKRQALETTIAAAFEKRQELRAAMETMIPELSQRIPLDEKGVCLLLQQFLASVVGTWDQGTIPTSTAYKENCADVTRKFKSPIFNRQKDLLSEMKKLKKEQQQQASS